MKKIAFIFTVILVVSCNGSKTASAKDTPAASLEGSWELDYISGPRIAFDGLYPGEKPYANFDLKENRISGKNSCNNYSGSFILEGHKIHFNPNMISTKMFCKGEGEGIYMATLPKITSYDITDNGKTLNLISGDIALMRFHRK